MRFLPSGRSLLIGFGLLALAVSGYLGARMTSMFAVQNVEVIGARPLVLQRVDAALEPLAGKSLLALDAAAIDRQLERLPDVKLIAYDRAFPHTARVVISAERPVAVLRRGTETWLVSDRGRILRRLANHPRSTLPRIWIAGISVPSDGALLSDEEALRPTLALGRVLSADHRFFGRVAQAQVVDGGLVLLLRTGTELRLGAGEDVALQVAVARRVLSVLALSPKYIDVSLPERTVVLPEP